MAEGDEVRCTDNKLFELCQKFDDHVELFKKHVLDDHVKFNNMIDAQIANTDAITSLTTQVSEVVINTSAIVQLHKDFQGAACIGSGVQRFLVWCLKWGGIFGGIGFAVKWTVEYFTKH